LRVLYNASYLTNEYSEKMMELLTQSEFKDGLAAGVPDNLKIAHKFGISTVFTSSEEISSRELHDCGIIYHPDHPYILCVMTKGHSKLSDSEGIIKKISQNVYEAVEQNNF